MAQIITNQFQKELKQHGSEHFPFLVSYQKLSEYESGAFMWHWHPEIEITYVQTGSMCYKVNNLTYHLKEGDIVFNNSNALHSGAMENHQDCSYIPVTSPGTFFVMSGPECLENHSCNLHAPLFGIF